MRDSRKEGDSLLKKHVHYTVEKQTSKSWQKILTKANKQFYLVAIIVFAVPATISYVSAFSDVNRNESPVVDSHYAVENQSSKTFLLSEEESKERLRNKPPVSSVVQDPVTPPEVKPVEAPPAPAPVAPPVEVPAPPKAVAPVDSRERFAPLLAVIAQAESGGNYNAYFNKSRNAETRFTDMSIAQVLQWQREYVDNGSASSAVGKYQIIQKTMRELTSKNSISHDDKFDEAMQDRLAIVLLEKRGINKYTEGKISREQFATNLAKEWASLPSVNGQNPGASYYEKDGINKAGVTIEQLYKALDQL